MRFLTVFFTLTWFTIGGAFAQSGYFEDAYRFSRANPSGSARIMGIGGTQYSLGGDVSNIAGNPAGLGFFRSSEASISLGYSDWKVDTRYLNQAQTYNTSNFNLPNMSYVMANPKGNLETKAFKGGAFGFSFQRIANFNTEFGYNSNQPGNSSIIDFYVQDAYNLYYNFGFNLDDIAGSGLTGLGYNTFQFNPAYDDNFNIIDGEFEPIIGNQIAPFQNENIIQEGNSNQITIAYGANFNHKFFVGGSMGIRSISFSSFKTYGELFNEGPLRSSNLTESLFINGAGVNINLGVIYKPIDYLNLGFNFQSPTLYSLNEEYEAGVVADFGGFYFEPEDLTLGREEAVTNFIISNYGLNTPLKIGGGATFFIGKNGFISADIDWVDYSAGRINSKDFDESPDNQAIRNTYTSTLNYRLGGEARFDLFRIRAGYAFFGDPFANPAGFDQSTQQLSGGIGVKLNSINLDFALVNQKYSGQYRSYQVLDENNNNFGPVTQLENSIISGVLTIGYNF
ncbi:OmpP1/FadL family transporter [Algoriphagus boritolerans]|uniref:Outer membrane protein transport protein (OMPP1/FadL/TodX) n=1 Tax=Algoriphagus boritolerans DSM 17298 = JCM 18970 TaxID=1120964 RepID=A0A1H5WL05_9BACT|nr:outer membrane protein transport protein [Algoriphagus boritolerans]SEG00025.1 Outer membrane protein transport protein (OMPP1/FadL/TodX) [Algoriphagus boritolerans DSM 17298 = JCM 18970]